MADFIDGIVAKRGSAGGGDAPDAKAPSYGDAKRSALDDLARILRVDKGDRAAFDSAMADLVEACSEDDSGHDTAEPDEESSEDTDEG